MRVNGNIDFVSQKGVFDLLGKESFSLNLIKAHVLDFVASGFDNDDLGFNVDELKLVLEKVGLPQCEVTASAADSDLIAQ